ncbi:hypothetical protein A0H81_14600 [Grifola frondosa]|uniref:Uncharacterized protein n=1 Tax=Grifola frondosa TaxID=5627 RepID=A0A1C7LLB2_GRIFR|nr:hypothetical protein A0H81_14600 [Grifola frondosa]
MIPEHLAGHFTECLSHLVFASIPAGQKTLALIDPTTGKLEQYTLVKVNNCPAECPAPTVHARSRLSRRTLSEGGLALPREPSALRSRHIRSVRYSEKSLLNISLDMLRKMDDSTWPTHPEPKALIGRSSSPPHRLKMSASFTRFGIPFTGDDSNPSLLNESYPPDISSPSPFPILRLPSGFSRQ